MSAAVRRRFCVNVGISPGQVTAEAGATLIEAFMASFVILLRAVNVGGTGKLPMSDLNAIGKAAGLRAVRTYIASGNMVAESDDFEPNIKAKVEQQLLAYAHKPIGVVVRTAEEMTEVLARNPFPHAEPKHTNVSSSMRRPHQTCLTASLATLTRRFRSARGKSM